MGELDSMSAKSIWCSKLMGFS